MRRERQPVQMNRVRKSEEPDTKYERFSARSGRLMEKTFVPVGSADGMEVSVLKIRDLMKEESFLGLHVTYEQADEYSSETFTAVLDDDEYAALCTCLEGLLLNARTAEPEHYTEVVFTARCGFQAGAYWADRLWHPFVRLDRYDDRTSVFMSRRAFADFAEIIDRARMHLNA